MALSLAAAPSPVTQYPGGLIVVRANDYPGAGRGTLETVADGNSVSGDVIRESQQLTAVVDSTDVDDNYVAAENTLEIPVADLALVDSILYIIFASVRCDGELPDNDSKNLSWLSKKSGVGTMLAWHKSSDDPSNNWNALSYLPLANRAHYALVLAGFLRGDTDSGDSLIFRGFTTTGGDFRIYLDALYLVPDFATGLNNDVSNNHDYQEYDLTGYPPFDPSGVWEGVWDDRAALSDQAGATGIGGEYSVWQPRNGVGTEENSTVLDLQEGDDEPAAVDVYGFGETWDGTGVFPRDNIVNPKSRLWFTAGPHAISDTLILRDDFARGTFPPYPDFAASSSGDFGDGHEIPLFMPRGACSHNDAPVVAGQLLIAIQRVDPQTVDPLPPANWTLLARHALPNTQELHVFYSITDGTESTTDEGGGDYSLVPKVTQSQDGTWESLTIVLDNIDGSAPIIDFDFSDFSSLAGGDPYTSPAITCEDDGVIVMFTYSSNAGFGSPIRWITSIYTHNVGTTFPSASFAVEPFLDGDYTPCVISIKRGDGGKENANGTGGTADTVPPISGQSELARYADGYMWNVAPSFGGANAQIVCVGNELAFGAWNVFGGGWINTPKFVYIGSNAFAETSDFDKQKKTLATGDEVYAYTAETSVRLSGVPSDKFDCAVLGSVATAQSTLDFWVGAALAIDGSGDVTLRLCSFESGISSQDFSSEEAVGSWADDRQFRVKVERRFYWWRAKAWIDGDAEPDWMVEGAEPALYRKISGGTLHWCPYPYEDNFDASLHQQKKRYPLAGSATMYPGIGHRPVAASDIEVDTFFDFYELRYPFDDTGANTHMRLIKYDGSHDYGSVTIPFGSQRLVMADLDNYHFTGDNSADEHGYDAHLWKSAGGAEMLATILTDVLERRGVGVNIVSFTTLRGPSRRYGKANR